MSKDSHARSSESSPLLLNPKLIIYIAGHNGLVGSALWRDLEQRGFKNLLGWTSHELDLRDSETTIDAICTARPDVILMAAAKVGGIGANSNNPVQFLNDNLKIQTNIF